MFGTYFINESKKKLEAEVVENIRSVSENERRKQWWKWGIQRNTLI